jgi:hypothetical protein
MDLDRELAGGGTAWMLYRTYHLALWPLGTLVAGILGLGLVFPALGAIPIFAIGYSGERRRQKKLRSTSDSPKPGTRREEPSMPPALMMTLAMVIALLGLYYAGSLIALVWGSIT